MLLRLVGDEPIEQSGEGLAHCLLFTMLLDSEDCLLNQMQEVKLPDFC
jgi:hypothetical protein